MSDDIPLSYRTVAEVVGDLVAQKDAAPFTRGHSGALGRLHRTTEVAGSPICGWSEMVEPVATALWTDEPDRRCEVCVARSSTDG